MVFEINGEDESGDPAVSSWSETLDSAGYNASLEAEAGHYALCEKWARHLMPNARLTWPQKAAKE